MRALLAIAIAGCSGAAPSRTAPGPLEASPASGQPLAVEAAGASVAGSAGLPGPPRVADPPTGTWHVQLEVKGWVARPSAIAVDGTGVYVTGPAFRDGKVDERRWAIAKLDRATGKPLWSVVEDVANGPMPEHLALGGGALIVAGHESNYAKLRSLVFERRDPKTGGLLWRRVMPEKRSGAYSLGGITLRGTTLLYAATREGGRPEASFGELALATGKPTRAAIIRADRRGRHIVSDDTGSYLLGDDHDNKFTLEQLDTSWAPIATSPAGQVLRMIATSGGLIAWFRSIEKYATDGARVWTSKLVGDFVSVAIDDTGIYVAAMIDASTKAYYALAKLDPATGAVAWSRRTAEYEESRPSLGITLDGDAIYMVGYLGDRWFVERRRKLDGAIGDVKPAIHVLAEQVAPQLAK